MVTSTNIKVGGVVQLNLAASPSGADLSSLTYRVVPATGIVALQKNPTGIQVKGLAAGTAKVFADVSGLDARGIPAIVEAECDVTVKKSVLKQIMDFFASLWPF